MSYRLSVNGTQLDLPDAVALQPVVGRRLFDPNTSTPSVGDLSYNLTLPRTATNEEVLLWAYEPDRRGGASILPLLVAEIVVGSTIVLQGALTVETVTADGIGARIIGLNADWLARLEGRTLQDLDLGTMGYSGVDTPSYGLVSLFDVWQTTEADGLPLQFPLVSYGNFAADPDNTDPNPLNDGAQTVAGSAGIVDGALIDNRQEWPFTVEEFRPAPYLRHVLREVLRNAGIQVGGEVMADPYLDDIILPYTNDNDQGFTLPYDFIEAGNWQAEQVKGSTTWTATLNDNPFSFVVGIDASKSFDGINDIHANRADINVTRRGLYRFRWYQALDLFPNDLPVRYSTRLYSGSTLGNYTPAGDGTQIYADPRNLILPLPTEFSRDGVFEIELEPGINYRLLMLTFYDDTSGPGTSDAGVFSEAFIDQQQVQGQLEVRLALPRIDALQWLRGTLNHFGMVLVVGRDGRTADLRYRQSIYGPGQPLLDVERADYRLGKLTIPQQPASVVLDYAIQDDEALYEARQFAATHANGRGYHQGERVDVSIYAGTGSRTYTWLTQGITTDVPTLNTRDEFSKLLGRLGDGSEQPKYSYLPRLLRWQGLRSEATATEGLWVADQEYLLDGVFAWPRAAFVEAPGYGLPGSLSFNDTYGEPGLYRRLHQRQLRVLADGQQLEVNALLYPFELDTLRPGVQVSLRGHRWAVIEVQYRPASDTVSTLRLIKVD